MSKSRGGVLMGVRTVVEAGDETRILGEKIYTNIFIIYI